jgi:hypothetical protein
MLAGLDVQHLSLFGYSFIILGGIAIVMVLYNVPRFFAVTFFFLSFFHIITAAIESTIAWDTHDWVLYNIAIWIISCGIFAGAFFLLYILYQKMIFGKIRGDWTAAMGIFLIGILLVIGVINDFSQVLMAGLDFNQADLWWHFDLINGVFPAGYLLIIPGFFLLIAATRWASKENIKKIERTIVLIEA